MTDRAARQLIVQITNELFTTGHLTATGGNVSALAEEEGTVWVTPSRMYKGGIAESDLVRIREDGTVVEGERTPTVEWQMHYASYRTRPGTTGAVHTHSPVATAFGITRQVFPPINTDAVFLRDTVTVPWLMPGSKDLADAVGEALKTSRGCILRNHGLMAVGQTLRDAATRAMMIEETAKLVLYCKQFGGEVTLLPDEWVERLAQLADFI